MKELEFLMVGFVVGAAADYSYRAKALSEYNALKLWVRGEAADAPAWFKKEVAAAGKAAAGRLQAWAAKL
jgi:hypothetical protein